MTLADVLHDIFRNELSDRAGIMRLWEETMSQQDKSGMYYKALSTFYLTIRKLIPEPDHEGV